MAEELVIDPLKLTIRGMRKVEEALGVSYRNIEWGDVTLDLLSALTWAVKSEDDPAYSREDAEREHIGPVLAAYFSNPGGGAEPADPTPPPSGSGGG